jgi:hypothetical protein
MDAEDRQRRQNDELAREDEAVQALIAAARAENDRDGATERVTTLVEEHRIGHSRLNVKFSDARGLQLTIAAALLSDAESVIRQHLQGLAGRTGNH